MVVKKLLSILILIVSYNLCAQEPDIDIFLRGTNVSGITGDRTGIWAATNGNGIFHFSYSDDEWNNYSTAEGNIQHDFFYCIAANDDFVWAGSTDGLFMLNKKRDRWSKRKFGKGGQLGNWIRSVEWDSVSNVLWIGRFKYLSVYDLKKRRFFDIDLTIGGDAKTNTIKSIAVDGDSLVWFGTEAGIHKYDKSLEISDNSAISFFDNRLNYFNGEGETVSISSIMLEQNYIWIGLDEFITESRPDYNVGGLYRFDRRNEWIKLDYSDGLSANGIFCTSRTGDYIWAAQYQFGSRTKEMFGRGLAIINRNTFEIKNITDDRIPSTINSMYFDGYSMWLGSDNGVVRIKIYNKFTEWNFGKSHEED